MQKTLTSAAFEVVDPKLDRLEPSVSRELEREASLGEVMSCLGRIRKYP